MDEFSEPSAGLATPSILTTDLLAAQFLARYSGNTRTLYGIRMRQWFTWCRQHNLDPVRDITRPHVELFGRWLEEVRGNAPGTVHGALSTIRIFYRLLAIDGTIARSPAEHIRMPRVFTDEVKVVGLNRLELGSFMATARAMSPDHSALAVLLGMLGLHVSEACAVRVGDFQGYERDHRVLRLIGKGKKPATIPLPPTVSAELDRCAEGRPGWLLHSLDGGTPLNRNAAARMVKAIGRKAGIKKNLTPHALRHSFVTNALDAGVPLRDVQIAARHSDPRTTTRYDRARVNHERHAVHTLATYIMGDS